MNVNNVKEEMDATNDKEDVAILVPSFDGYEDLWKPFFHCFFKYWPDCPYPIYLGSNFKTHEDPIIKPIHIGPDRDYSSNLIAMLGQMPYKWVLIMIEDVLLCKPVRTDILRNLIAEAKEEDTALVHLLTGRFDANVSFASKPTSSQLSELPINLPYRSSINIGFWNKSALLKILLPGESAWAFEYGGSRRTFTMPDRFFCISKKYVADQIFNVIHGVIKRKWTYAAKKFLKEEGLLECIKTRPVQSFQSHLYLKIYVIIRYLVFWIAYHLFGTKGMLWLVNKKSAANLK